MKRALSLILVFSMLIGMVNTSVFADSNAENGIYFTKEIVSGGDGQPDRLKLEAYTTGVVTEAAQNIPTDIVLVLDQSGSMDYALDNSTVLEVMKGAVESFVSEVEELNDESGNYRVAIVGFASQSGYNDNTEILTLTREVEVEEDVYVEVDGELDTSKSYYVERSYNDYTWYAEIVYRSQGPQTGWRFSGQGGQRVDVTTVTVYEKTVTTTTEDVIGIAYNDLTSSDYENALVECDSDAISSGGILYEAIAALEGEGATETDLGLEMAMEILAAAAEEPGYASQQVVVLLTDGQPTTYQDFEYSVANAAIAYAKGIKDTGAHIFSMYLGSPGTNARTFLQAVSSNYPDAENMTSLGSQAASSYYSAHSESAAINNVFSQIISSIVADAQLNEKSVVTDVLTDYFRLPYISDDNYDIEQIQTYTVDYLGDDTWSDTEEIFDTAVVEIADKEISVSGFNFAYHCITEDPKTDVTRASDHGRKLVIYIPIVPDENSDNFGGYLPTNEDAGIYQAPGSSSPVETADSQYADVAINYDLTAAERAYHVDGTQLSDPVEFVFEYSRDNMNSILEEMIERVPDGDTNAGVNMEYRLYDIGTDDRNTAQEGDTSDDVLVASLSVPYGESVDVTNASKWTWEADSAVITIPANGLFAEKVYVLVCTLTNRNDPADTLTVYDYLDISVVRGDLAHIVYGTIDEGGSVSVIDDYDASQPELNDKGSGSIMGGTYTEAVTEGKNSDTMVFTIKDGYEIESILLVTSDQAPYDTRQYIYDADDPTIQSEVYPVTLDADGGWSVAVENVQSGVAFEVATRSNLYKLITSHDEGSSVTDSTTFSYHDTEKLEVYFAAHAGYYLTQVTVNGDVWTAERVAAMTPEERAEYGLVISDTAVAYDEEGNSISVITAGIVQLPKVKDYTVDVKSSKQYHKLTYNYYVEESSASYPSWEASAPYENPIVYYVAYGDSLPIPNPTEGDKLAISGHNHTLSTWYTDHNGLDFYGATDLNDVKMPGKDMEYHAYWTKNPDVAVATVTVQKIATAGYTEASTFTFNAMFHENPVGQVHISLDAGSFGPVAAEMEIVMTDAEFDQFKAGNGYVYLTEAPGKDTDVWKYDSTVYELRWINDSAMLFANGTPVMEDEAGNLFATFENELVAAPVLEVTDKTLVEINDVPAAEDTIVKVGDKLEWRITVKNTGKAEGTVTADMIEDVVLYLEGSEWKGFDDEAVLSGVPVAIAPGGEAEVVATWIVPQAAVGKIIKNIAKITNDPDDPTESEETEVGSPDLKVDKSNTSPAAGTIIEAGDQLVWTITVTNSGNVEGKFKLDDTLSNQEDVTIDDTGVAKDGDYYLVPANDGTTDGVVTFTATYTVKTSDVGTTIVNHVEIKEPGDTNEDPDKEDDSDPVDVAPYTVRYVDGVENEEVFPDQVYPELDHGVDTPAFEGEPVREGYLFTGWAPEVAPTVTGNAIYTAQWTGIVSDLTVDKTVSKVGDQVVSGTIPEAKIHDTIEWTIVVRNDGNISETFTLIDRLTDGRTVTIQEKISDAEFAPVTNGDSVTIPSGETKIYIVSYTVTAQDYGTDLVNKVTLDNDKDDPTDTSEEVPVEPAVPVLTVKKVVSGIRQAGKEILGADSKPTEAIMEGAVITWTITVQNDGTGKGQFKLEDQLTIDGIAANDVLIADHVAGTVYELEVGNTKTFTATYTVKDTDAAKSIINTATITDPEDNELDEDPADPVDIAPYTVTYVDGVENEEVFPDQVYSDLDHGVDTPVFEGEPVREGYLFTGWAPEVAPTVTCNATYTAQWTGIVSDLTVDKTVSKVGDQVVSGTIPEAKIHDTIEWTIVVQNSGNRSETFTLKEELTGGRAVTIQEKVSDTEFVPVANGASITIGAGITKTYIVTYEVTAQDYGTALVNKVTLDDGDDDPSDDPTDETPEVPVEQEPISAIDIDKSVDDTSVKVGEIITYTLVITNTGETNLTNVKVTDTFDGDISKIEDLQLSDGVSYEGDGVFDIGTLAARDKVTIKFSYVTRSNDVGKLTNTALAEGIPENGEAEDNKVTDNDSSDPVDVAEDDDDEDDDPIIPVGPTKPDLNMEDHYAYIVGYPDGLVHPERNITRAEVSTIFFRMLLDESRDYFWAQTNNFTDVTADKWFNNAISTLANADLINGYPDGSFKPNANITRAEFATIAIRFFLDEDVEITENNLSDVKGHWAEANIDLAYALGLINGYPDGTFRPNQLITRAEAMTIVNRVLKRAPHKDHLLEDMIVWPDNLNEDVWYYADVQEATNSHEFHMDKDDEYEIWTELLPVRDWVALEQEWSEANSSRNPGEVVDIKINTPEAVDEEGSLTLN